MTYTLDQMYVMVLIILVIVGVLYGIAYKIRRTQFAIKTDIYYGTNDIINIICMNIEFDKAKIDNYDNIDEYLDYILTKSTEEILRLYGIYNYKRFAKRCIEDVIEVNMDRIMVAIDKVNAPKRNRYHTNVVPMRSVKQ